MSLTSGYLAVADYSQIAAETPPLDAIESQRVGHAVEAFTPDRRQGVDATDDGGGDERHHFVDESQIEERPQQGTTSFYEEAGDLAAAEKPHHLFEIDSPIGGRYNFGFDTLQGSRQADWCVVACYGYQCEPGFPKQPSVVRSLPLAVDNDSEWLAVQR